MGRVEMIWASTLEMGCALSYCRRIRHIQRSPEAGRLSTLLVCHYSPELDALFDPLLGTNGSSSCSCRGNISGERPYQMRIGD